MPAAAAIMATLASVTREFFFWGRDVSHSSRIRTDSSRCKLLAFTLLILYSCTDFEM